MTDKLRIVFLDDQPNVARNAAEQLPDFIKEGATIEVLELEQVKHEIDSLFKRYRRFLGGESVADVIAAIPSQVDGADFLILDYDLKDTSAGGEWASGLEVARTARAFTTADSIVLLNQFRGGNKFDLTMVEGTSSFADLDVPRLQLANSGLWRGSGFGGFRPWTWPDLSSEPGRFRTLCDWVRKHLDHPILPLLGLNGGTDAKDDPSKTISRESWTSVMSDPNATLRQLIERGGFVPPASAERLMDDPTAAPRVSASVFSRWFERSIWRPQDVFVDAAHLAHLAPWLLTQPEDMDGWQRACTLEESSVGVFIEAVRAFEVPQRFLASRPLFRYGDIQAAPQLAKPKGFSFDKLPALAFCEDVSQFVDRGSERAYPSLLPGRYSVRFVCDQDSFPGTWPEVQDPKRVDYVPQSLFAL